MELGLHERRTGVVCLSAQSALWRRQTWEEKHPAAVSQAVELADAHRKQDLTFRTTQSFTRLTAAEALRQFARIAASPRLERSPSTMAEILNRNGYRLRPVLKAKPPKSPSKPMLFWTLSGLKTNATRADASRRLSIDCKGHGDDRRVPRAAVAAARPRPPTTTWPREIHPVRSGQRGHRRAAPDLRKFR